MSTVEEKKHRAQKRWERVNRKQMRLTGILMELYRRCEESQWPHEKLLRERNERFYGSPDYAATSTYVHEFLRGVEHVLMQRLWDVTVFSYEIDGKRLMLGTPEYRAVSPMTIDTDTGAFVYKAEPHGLFTIPKKEVQDAS
jgi:hypothetical protein